ncbi:MAG: hypothetical protein Q4C65_04970 [Eubacteriales bacterium]|nr:hypothetical protein [Eubacteriales bacterium]
MTEKAGNECDPMNILTLLVLLMCCRGGCRCRKPDADQNSQCCGCTGMPAPQPMPRYDREMGDGPCMDSVPAMSGQMGEPYPIYRE